MSHGYAGPLYMLAFDHRTSFRTKLFGISGEPTQEQRRRMADAKLIVLDGLCALASAVPPATARALGALVDEESGEAAARAAKERGITLAMCAERSSRDEFELEYGERFAEHIEAFDPEFVKVLVRYNPEADAALNRRQAERLARLSEWVSPRRARLLFELIVPPEPGQLGAVGSHRDRYVRELRPSLAASAIGELQRAGVEPDVWKVEGLDSVADCRIVAEAARAGGRDEVGCVVLGAGADEETVERWLNNAARAEGFIGFAIGRTIFWGPLTDWLNGKSDRDAAVAAIAANYRGMIDCYAAVEAPG